MKTEAKKRIGLKIFGYIVGTNELENWYSKRCHIFSVRKKSFRYEKPFLMGLQVGVTLALHIC